MALTIDDERRMRRYGLRLEDDADLAWFPPATDDDKLRIVSFPRMIGAFMVLEGYNRWMGPGRIVRDGRGFIEFKWRREIKRAEVSTGLAVIADGKLLSSEPYHVPKHVLAGDHIITTYTMNYNHDFWTKWHLENMR